MVIRLDCCKRSHAITRQSSIGSKDVAEAVVLMLSRSRHVAIRDLVMLLQNQF
jgi:NADP-dependent 3-hydroxy acid dehydrogenase YdfG